MTFILDNRDRRVGDFLRERIAPGARLSIVSAYFTIYAYEALRDSLEGASAVRFLYGEPRGVGEMDPAEGESRAFRLTDDGGIALKHALAQRALARDCAAWIERLVEIRTVSRSGFLHGKAVHIAPPEGGSGAAVVGSSNFTRRGLGFGAAPNIELNIEIGGADDRAVLLRWFDNLWGDDSLTRDARAEVLTALARLGAACSPEFVYYKTLFHVFAERLAEHHDRDGLLRDVHLQDTAVWKALYGFQRDGATSAINRLLRHNGCILADSVGLGKTWTALAVVKFFELRNERVLVLCPRKLVDNWTRYSAAAADSRNPFETDRLNYTVLAHTDLSREAGRSGQVDLAHFNWGAFDLVVIDESHNFRNEGRDRVDEAGNVVRRSRYNRLLEEVFKEGARTKVLMLSATPVNTGLRDLRNQIYLMTEKRPDAFRDALGIGDIQNLFGVAQRQFLEWEKERRAGGGKGKADLLARLGADFLALLDAVTIARSRGHLRRHYAEETARFGGFPERAPPMNRYPRADTRGALSYDDLRRRIGDFRLAVYRPSDYLVEASAPKGEAGGSGLDQRHRETNLVAMMRTNLLKRLESSTHAFRLTAGRILAKIEEMEGRIADWRAHGGGEIDARPDDDEEDEEFAVGRTVRYSFDELDIDRWARDLDADRQTFAELEHRAALVTPDRDAKLAELLKLLADKVSNPTRDKDGKPNRKALVFTSFADTARYLYEQVVASRVGGGPGAHVALVTGGDGNASTLGVSRFGDVLARFAPRAQQAADDGEEIDILIATDCLSEGQNLQDCDLVANYDIHWNPVRLMQRFGRIDRLGGRNARVAMTNFWPTQDLDRYLDLKNRVEARMALADAAATGQDDLLAVTEAELTFRDEQLRRLRGEILDLEDSGDGVSLSDLTLDDFIADLLHYIQAHRAALEAAPFGVYAVADRRWAAPAEARPGAIFCLRRKSTSAARGPNRLDPYFLVHVRADGGVRYTFRQAAQCLALFRALAAGRAEASMALENAFDRETGQGRRMEKYETLLAAALRSVAGALREATLRDLTLSRDALLPKPAERPDAAENFELVTWLVISDAE